MLEELIREQIKTAMRQRDELTKDILRLVIGEFQTAASTKDISENDKLLILKKVIKGIDSSLEQIVGLTDRDELRNKLSSEKFVLEKFLPQTMSVDELKAFIASNNIDLSNQGKAIGTTIKLLKQNQLSFNAEDVKVALKG